MGRNVYKVVNKKEKLNIEQVILYILAVYIAVNALYSVLYGIAPLGYQPIGMLLITVILVPIAYMIQMHNWKTIRTVIYVAVAVLVMIWRRSSLFSYFIQAIAPCANKYIELYNEYYADAIPPVMRMYEDSPSETFFIFIVFVLSVVFCYILRKHKGIVVVTVLFMVPICLSTNVGFFPSTKACLKLLAAFILFYMVYSCNSGQYRIVFRTATVGAVLIVVTMFLTKPFMDYVDKKEVKYQTVRADILRIQQMDLMTAINEVVHAKAPKDLNTNGGKLKGWEERNPKNVKLMEVVLSSEPTEDIYLRGYTGARFDGNKWNEVKHSQYMIYNLEFDSVKRELMEVIPNILNYLDEESSTITIYKNGLKSKYAYPPYNCIPPYERKIYYDSYIEARDDYDKETFEFYYRSQVESIKNSSDVTVTEDGYEITKAYEVLGEEYVDEFFWGKMDPWIEYENFVLDNYLDISNYPEKMESWNMTVDEVSNIIDRYFSNGFHYDIRPGKTPESENFVEYFITTKRGFCIHFATLATLKYRSYGIPARYIEGYIIDRSAFKKQADGTYKAVVTDNMAHAWCEVFDADWGWTPKEHTPGYGVQRQENNVQSVDTTVQQETTTNAEEQTTAAEQTTDSGEKTTATVTDNNNKASRKGLFSGFGSKIADVFERVKEPVTFLIAVCLGILGMNAQRKFRRKRLMRRFKTRKDNLGISCIYNEMYKLSVACGMKRINGSDRVVNDAMKNAFYERVIAEEEPNQKNAIQNNVISEEEWEWLIDCAIRARFTGQEIDKSENVKMYKIYARFRANILKQMAAPKRLWCVYIRAL